MLKVGLFRYHEGATVCANRLELFRHFNPGVPIHGIYGGPEDEFPGVRRALAGLLDTSYCIRGRSAEWKWKNFDFVLADWYRNLGARLRFDQFYLFEWDFVQLGSIDHLYGHIALGQVGLTGLVPLRKVERKWYWTQNARRRAEWLTLLRYVRERHGYAGSPLGAYCPGLTGPATFLERIAGAPFPDLVHDELRLPLYAQIFGFDTRDTGFLRKWFSRREARFFNCEKQEIEPGTVMEQLRKRRGRRTFHPVKGVVPVQLVGDPRH
jgi:hypothetical protein